MWHIILLCKVVDKNCRLFFKLKAFSSLLKNEKNWKHWLYCFVDGFECSIFIRFNPNCSTCSQNMLETFPCKPIKDLQHKYSFWPKSMQNQTLVTLALVLISVNDIFFYRAVKKIIYILCIFRSLNCVLLQCFISTELPILILTFKIDLEVLQMLVWSQSFQFLNPLALALTHFLEIKNFQAWFKN